MGYKTVERLEGFRRRNSENHNYVNKDVYRMLFNEDIYIIAYNNIRNNDGAETKGSDDTSLHGFCQEWVDDIIVSLKDESYRPIPSRITYIPKKNGKQRKLSFPNGKDKLVQEVVRMILESIYEPSFSNLSHGFRPNRSIHSCIAQVSTWQKTTWLIEGDITACFDEVDHRILESILKEKISDERFLRLINKLLRAGYFNMDGITFQNTKQGTGQGSICSPILANIYLDKLDRHLEMVIERDTLGKYKRMNPEYRQLWKELKKAEASEDRALIKEAKNKLKGVSSKDDFDPNFRRVRYVRYADDFLIGIIASKEYAKKLKEEIKTFLKDTLNLRLNDEKTKITHAKRDKAHFLGYIIIRKNKVMQINMDIKTTKARLKDKGLYKEKPGKTNGNIVPIGITKLLRAEPQEIIKYGNSILHGYRNGNQGCTNYHEYWFIQYIIQYSIAKTLARKYDVTMKKIFKKYGNQLTVKYKDKHNKPKEIKLTMMNSYKRDKTFFPKWLKKIKNTVEYKYDDRNKLNGKCCVCGSKDNLKMYHRKRKGLMSKPYAKIEEYLLLINRRQTCICPKCFEKEEQNKIKLMQFNRRKLV